MISKILKILTLLSLCLAFSACKKKDPELEVVLTSNSSYAINNPAFTCTQLRIGVNNDDTGDIPSRRMIWGKPKFIWKNKDRDLIIDQMAVVFTSPLFGKFVYDAFDVEEIGAIITGKSLTAIPGYDAESGTIVKAPEKDNQVITGKCEIRAGGLNVRSTATTFRATGKLKVIGRSFRMDGTNVVDEIPVYAEAILYIDYATF